MVFTNYYKAEKLNPEVKSRYDIVASSDSYDLFEILNNKRGFNRNGKPFSYAKVQDKWNCKEDKRKPENALTKNSHNISSVFFKDLTVPIARGQVNIIDNIYEMVKEKMLDEEMNMQREKAIKYEVTQYSYIKVF